MSQKRVAWGNFQPTNLSSGYTFATAPLEDHIVFSCLLQFWKDVRAIITLMKLKTLLRSSLEFHPHRDISSRRLIEQQVEAVGHFYHPD